MSNKLKALLAILMASAMLFGLAACGGGGTGDDDLPPEFTTTEAVATEPETEDAIIDLECECVDCEDCDECSCEDCECPVCAEAGDGSATEEPTTDTNETTAPDATGEDATTEATTARPAAPSTTAEIVAYYNAAANRVKTDRPGFTWADRTIIDSSRISSENSFLNTIAPRVLGIVESQGWLSWSDARTVAPGANHNSFFVPDQTWSSRLQPEWVQSATLTETATEYQIRIVLRDERIPELPRDMTTTRHGQVMRIMDWDSIMAGVEDIAIISINSWNSLYSGSFVEANIDKNTGNMKRVRFMMSLQADVTARALGITLPASLPLAQEAIFTINH